MKLTKTQRLILYSLGQFYEQLNQPLTKKPLKLETSKIAFINFVLHSHIVTKQERALYKNLESLETNKLIEYRHRMIQFTDSGLKILDKINLEVQQFADVKALFMSTERPKRKLQTVIKS